MNNPTKNAFVAFAFKVFLFQPLQVLKATF